MRVICTFFLHSAPCRRWRSTMLTSPARTRLSDSDSTFRQTAFTTPWVSGEVPSSNPPRCGSRWTGKISLRTPSLPALTAIRPTKLILGAASIRSPQTASMVSSLLCVMPEPHSPSKPGRFNDGIAFRYRLFLLPASGAFRRGDPVRPAGQAARSGITISRDIMKLSTRERKSRRSKAANGPRRR